MSGKLNNWPAWKEFKAEDKSTTCDPDFYKVKREIVAQYGKDSLLKSWLKVCKDLKKITDDLENLGSAAVPIFNMEDIIQCGLNEKQKTQLKSTGCCIVRGTIPEEEADLLFRDLKTFVAENRETITGWPTDSPSILNLYNSPTQIAVRTHPNQILLQKTLNELFHDISGETSPDPLSYTDAVRIRPSGQAFLGLGPHIDAGSLSRWADPEYRNVYQNIFSGSPEAHDAFDLNVRKNADQFLYPAQAHSAVFRSFQGWTALTPAAPHWGTLMLYPNLSTTIAYVLLRPFFTAPDDETDILDAEKWKFDLETAWFPGTWKSQSQLISRASHPHLRLMDCLVHVPPMKAGDTVWWHTDMCHAVDPEHHGSLDASVVYVAACPSTAINKGYIKRQLEAALAGKPPPDCLGNIGLNETIMKGYIGFANLAEQSKAVLGFGLLSS